MRVDSHAVLVLALYQDEFMEHDAAEGTPVSSGVPPDAINLVWRTTTHLRVSDSKTAARGDHDHDEVQGKV